MREHARVVKELLLIDSGLRHVLQIDDEELESAPMIARQQFAQWIHVFLSPRIGSKGNPRKPTVHNSVHLTARLQKTRLFLPANTVHNGRRRVSLPVDSRPPSGVRSACACSNREHLRD